MSDARRPGRRATDEAAPPAEGVRMAWGELPAGLRQEIEGRLGAPVKEAVTQPGGFSPGVAARLRLANGERAFVKAVGAAQNPDSPGLHRAEARIAAALPGRAPAPRFLGSLDTGGWVVLLLEDVDGAMPAQPWVPAELARVLAALADLAGALTPAPIDAPPVAERFGEAFRGWRGLAAGAPRGEDDLAGLDPWALDHLAELAELEGRWTAGAAGNTLAHADLRADNMLLTGDRVYFVDWPWACLAAPWFDLLAMLPSVRMQGGPPPDPLFTAHPVASDTDPAAVTATLAAVCGFLVHQSRLPPPPGLPTLREFQAAQGRAALDWLRTRWPARSGRP